MVFLRIYKKNEVYLIWRIPKKLNLNLNRQGKSFPQGKIYFKKNDVTFKIIINTLELWAKVVQSNNLLKLSSEVVLLTQKIALNQYIINTN